MPKLDPDSKERNLYTLPKTGEYCVRKYVNGLERFRNLKTKNRREAVRLKDETIKDWEGVKTVSGRTAFRPVALELLEIISMGKAEKTFLDIEGTMRLHLLPFFGNSYLNEVPKRWAEYKAFQRRLSPKRKLTHDRKHLIQIFRHAVRTHDYAGVPEFPLDLQDKHVTPGRVFTVDEYWMLWRKANWKWKLIIKMAAIMGMRRKEIMTLEWSEIDFKQGLITLAPMKTKTRQGRIFPVEKSILRTLVARQKNSASPYVFPNRNTPLMPMEPSDRTWQRIQRRAGVKGKFHWLRHSNVTWALREGHSQTLIGKSRGMSSKVLERVYAHANTDDAVKMNHGIRSFLGRSARNNSERVLSSIKKTHA